jgi:hypothetical protein
VGDNSESLAVGRESHVAAKRYADCQQMLTTRHFPNVHISMIVPVRYLFSGGIHRSPRASGIRYQRLAELAVFEARLNGLAGGDVE